MEALKSTSNGAAATVQTALGQAFIGSSAAFQGKTNTVEIWFTASEKLPTKTEIIIYEH